MNRHVEDESLVEPLPLGDHPNDANVSSNSGKAAREDPPDENIFASLGSTLPLSLEEIPENRALLETIILPDSPQKISKPEIRSSLKALTLESIFAAVFYSIIGGALLSNFLLDLGAGPVEIGIISSIPLLADLIQPLGAYLADRTTSRHWYSISIFTPARLLWVILVPAIWLVKSSQIAPHQLVLLTLGIMGVANFLEALGRASWVSWMAVLVPERLRGRYFGVRNSLLSLTNLIGVPLLGLTVSAWPGGTLQGYSAILTLGILLGVLSQACQFFIKDVNPQIVNAAASDTAQEARHGIDFSILKDANFLRFVLYFGLWSFAVNVSNPFFNLYMLDNLGINVSLVTIYGSLAAGANLLMQVVWGRLADRIGNRPVILIVGVVVAVTPVLWLATKSDQISLWVWLPLLHLLTGGTWAAIDLCNNNLLMGVAPLRNQSSYFAIAAAVFGVSGAIGINCGGFLATVSGGGGLLGLFVLSTVLRVAALLPLLFVQEQRSVPLGQLMRVLFGLPKREQSDFVG